MIIAAKANDVAFCIIKENYGGVNAGRIKFSPELERDGIRKAISKRSGIEGSVYITRINTGRPPRKQFGRVPGVFARTVKYSILMQDGQ